MLHVTVGFVGWWSVGVALFAWSHWWRKDIGYVNAGVRVLGFSVELEMSRA